MPELSPEVKKHRTAVQQHWTAEVLCATLRDRGMFMRSKRFGEYLVSLRKQAGDLSQDEVIRISKRLSRSSKVSLSKSTLSLYERGEVTHLRPDLARLLADVYQVPLAEFVTRWVQEVYKIAPAFQHDSFVNEANRESCLLKGPSDEDPLRIISIENFKQLQETLPEGSEVGVCTLNFLDNDIFFDMVSQNLARGIRYFYLLPDEERITYKVFLSRVEARYPHLRKGVDGRRSFFLPRPPADVPANYALYIRPDGTVAGYAGILFDRRVQYFLVADPALTLRYYQSFLFAAAVANDIDLQGKLVEIQRLTMRQSLSHKRPSLSLVES